MDKRPTGLMVIRVWIEEGSSKPLRAEMRRTNDVSNGFTVDVKLTEKAQVLAEVGEFLDSVSIP